LIVLAFYIQTGPADMAENWGNLQDSVKLDTIKYAHSKGAKIIVSIGGETESPYSNNATAYGINIATWANANRLDGVDFDLENFGGHLVAGSLTDVQTVQWIADATNAARSVLGNDKIITHRCVGCSWKRTPDWLAGLAGLGFCMEPGLIGSSSDG
jgi:hypothetical protein